MITFLIVDVRELGICRPILWVCNFIREKFVNVTIFGVSLQPL